jgi:hypothetical protein
MRRTWRTFLVVAIVASGSLAAVVATPEPAFANRCSTVSRHGPWAVHACAVETAGGGRAGGDISMSCRTASSYVTCAFDVERWLGFIDGVQRYSDPEEFIYVVRKLQYFFNFSCPSGPHEIALAAGNVRVQYPDGVWSGEFDFVDRANRTC